MNQEVLVESPAEFRGNGGVYDANGRLDTNAMRINSPLLRDEWEVIDAEVQAVASQMNTAFDTLSASGLVNDLTSEGLGVMQVTRQRSSDMNPAEVNMDGGGEEEDDQEYDEASTPIPVISKTFSMNQRRLEATRRSGSRIDVSQVATATRKVVETAESLVVDGWSKKLDGKSLYGLTNHPNVIPVTLADFGTIGNIYPKFILMISTLDNANFHGPYGFFVKSTQWHEMQNRYDDGSGMTPYQELLKHPQINWILPNYALQDGEVVGMQLTRDNFDLTILQNPTAVFWDAAGPMRRYFRVLAALAPRPKETQSDQLGIALGTGA